MPVLVQCPDCGSKLKAPDTSIGRKVKCPKCGGVIPVPEEGEESVRRAEMGVRAEPPDSESAMRKARRRPRDDDEYEESPRRSRDRRDYDDDDDYDDLPRRRRSSRRSRAAEASTGLQMGLGIGSLSVGILGLLIAWIPLLGAFSWPLCAVGLVLGVVGLGIAISKGSAHGFPIAGTAVSSVALILSLVWVFIIARGVGHVAAIADQMQRDMERQQGLIQAGAAGPMTPPSGTLALAGGKARVDGELTNADPLDRIRPIAHCKVYTLKMTAGRTYQIDMLARGAARGRAGNLLDSYLRLENPDGISVAEDDDSGGNLNARIIFICPRDGTYRVVATTFVGGTGLFRLEVQER